MNVLYISANSRCPTGYSCYEGLFPNPKDGLLSFDNFPLSVFVNLQIVTLDNWDEGYQAVRIVYVLYHGHKLLL